MNADNRKIKILMIGPGEGAIGGILSLVETIRPVLRERVDLCYLPTVQARPFRESGVWSVRNIGYAVSQYARFLRVLLSFRPHIIHLHTSQSIAWLKDTFFVLVGKLLGYKVIVHVHACSIDELYVNGPRFLQRYSRRIFGIADAVIAISAEWGGILSNIVSSKKIYTLTNCIDVASFKPSSACTSQQGVRVLFVGSVGPRKGAFDLIETLGHLAFDEHALHTWIVGYEERDGCLAQAENRLKELQLENVCELLGTVVGERKVQLLSDADLFVLPSHNEGLPIAILEALAAGLPIVSTPVGGIPGAIHDGYNGFLVSPGDVNSLTEKIAILAKDVNLREIMGKRSREIAEHEYDVIPYAGKLISLYETLSKR